MFGTPTCYLGKGHHDPSHAFIFFIMPVHTREVHCRFFSSKRTGPRFSEGPARKMEEQPEGKGSPQRSHKPCCSLSAPGQKFLDLLLLPVRVLGWRMKMRRWLWMTRLFLRLKEWTYLEDLPLPVGGKLVCLRRSSAEHPSLIFPLWKSPLPLHPSFTPT